MYEVSAVAPQLIHLCAGRVSDLLSKADKYAGGRYDAEDLLNLVTTQPNTVLWVIYEGGDIENIVGAAVTTIVEYPKMLSCFIMSIGGENMDDWIQPWYSRIADFASQCGCSLVEGWGRPSWPRYLAKHDIPVTSEKVVLELRLDERRRIQTVDTDFPDGNPD